MTALLFTLLALSIWLHQDASRRQMQSPLAWVTVLWILGPLALAAYWARRPLFPGEARVGGTGWVLARSVVTALTAWVVLIAAVFIFTEPVHPHWVESVEWQTLPERWSL